MLGVLHKTDCKGRDEHGPARFLCHKICDSDQWNKASAGSTGGSCSGWMRVL